MQAVAFVAELLGNIPADDAVFRAEPQMAISSLLPAQGAGDDDGLEREVLYPDWYPALAPLAFDHELLALWYSGRKVRENVFNTSGSVRTLAHCLLLYILSFHS